MFLVQGVFASDAFIESWQHLVFWVWLTGQTTSIFTVLRLLSVCVCAYICVYIDMCICNVRMYVTCSLKARLSLTLNICLLTQSKVFIFSCRKKIKS